MGFLRSSCSFTRFRIIDEIPSDLWLQIPSKLKQFAFQDIDNTTQERAWGWTNFDDMLDTNWHVSPPEKGEYLTFGLRLETRRIPPAVLKKHITIALREEQIRNQNLGQKYINKNRKIELCEQVNLRLFKHFLPIPAIFDVVWSTTTNIVYLTSIQSKLIDLFMNFFTLTFDVHLEIQTPYNLAVSILDEQLFIDKLDNIELTRFV